MPGRTVLAAINIASLKLNPSRRANSRLETNLSTAARLVKHDNANCAPCADPTEANFIVGCIMIGKLHIARRTLVLQCDKWRCRCWNGVARRVWNT
jgi:hypothetical protein